MINSQKEGGRNWHLDGRAAHCPALHITAVLRGCEGLGRIRTAKSRFDPKSHRHPDEALWGALGGPSALLPFLHEANGTRRNSAGGGHGTHREHAAVGISHPPHSAGASGERPSPPCFLGRPLSPPAAARGRHPVSPVPGSQPLLTSPRCEHRTHATGSAGRPEGKLRAHPAQVPAGTCLPTQRSGAAAWGEGRVLSVERTEQERTVRLSERTKGGGW